jgi:hypothetical protein
MAVNRKFKDSVFSALFSNPETLRELYSALKGITLDETVPVTINTLEGVLYNDLLNDISFEIGDKLVVLIEHQSTINPNMAIRLLEYIAHVYEKILNSKEMYSTRKMQIPHPEFFVLYNGTAPYPAEKVLRLSDSFRDPSMSGRPADAVPSLELIVKVININEGQNEMIVKRCETLAGYSAFVAVVREFKKKHGHIETAMREAVEYCRDHDIMKEFIEKNASEVLNMLTDWNMDDALAVRWEDGLEEGLEKGLVRGREEALADLTNLLKSGKTVDEALAFLKTSTSLNG